MYAGKKLLFLQVHVYMYIKKKQPLRDFMGILKVQSVCKNALTCIRTDY